MLKNTETDPYRSARPPKQHELEMLQLIERRHPGFDGTLVDIGCASGSLIGLIAARLPGARYLGIDASRELVETAKMRLPGANYSFEVGDALAYEPAAAFDIAIASGVLSIFEDFERPVATWLSWLAAAGTLYIFGRFNSFDIDTVVRHRNNTRQGLWEGGLTSYSVHTVGRWLASRGCLHEFVRFRLAVELPQGPDPMRTYTKTTTDGDVLVLNGANLVAEHYFLIVQKPNK